MRKSSLNKLITFIQEGAFLWWFIHCQHKTLGTANPLILDNLLGNKIVDYSDVVGACRRCSNFTFILELTSGFKKLGKTIAR